MVAESKGSGLTRFSGAPIEYKLAPPGGSGAARDYTVAQLRRGEINARKEKKTYRRHLRR